ncbi:MAG: hypothetical protein ACXWO3_10290, partial [Isosphaeraceae bacterium]
MPPPSMQGGLEPHEAARFAKGKDGCGKVIAREETAVPTIRRVPQPEPGRFRPGNLTETQTADSALP